MSSPVLETIFWLLVAHALCDFTGIQGQYIADAKSRHHPAGKSGVWMWVLSAHAMIHAGAVAYVTGSLLLGCAEFAAHALTDFLKCEGKISYHTDQMLHIALKFVWAGIAVAMNS